MNAVYFFLLLWCCVCVFFLFIIFPFFKDNKKNYIDGFHLFIVRCRHVSILLHHHHHHQHKLCRMYVLLLVKKILSYFHRFVLFYDGTLSGDTSTIKSNYESCSIISIIYAQHLKWHTMPIVDAMEI